MCVCAPKYKMKYNDGSSILMYKVGRKAVRSNLNNFFFFKSKFFKNFLESEYNTIYCLLYIVLRFAGFCRISVDFVRNRLYVKSFDWILYAMLRYAPLRWPEFWRFFSRNSGNRAEFCRNHWDWYFSEILAFSTIFRIKNFQLLSTF
jgi:hypothetical protein